MDKETNLDNYKNCIISKNFRTIINCVFIFLMQKNH